MIGLQLPSCNPWKERRALLSKGIDCLEMCDYKPGARSRLGINLGVATPHAGPGTICSCPRMSLVALDPETAPVKSPAFNSPLWTLVTLWNAAALFLWIVTSCNRERSKILGNVWMLRASTAKNTPWVSPGSPWKLNWAPVKIRKVFYCYCTALAMFHLDAVTKIPQLNEDVFIVCDMEVQHTRLSTPQFMWEWIGKNSV